MRMNERTKRGLVTLPIGVLAMCAVLAAGSPTLYVNMTGEKKQQYDMLRANFATFLKECGYTGENANATADTFRKLNTELVLAYTAYYDTSSRLFTDTQTYLKNLNELYTEENLEEFKSMILYKLYD